MSTKKEYKLLIGSRAQVMHGTAKKTGGGLRKKDLKYNKYGKIVSKKASKSAKKCNNLVNAGYVTQKGSFGVIKKNQKGGDNIFYILFIRHCHACHNIKSTGFHKFRTIIEKIKAHRNESYCTNKGLKQSFMFGKNLKLIEEKIKIEIPFFKNSKKIKLKFFSSYLQRAIITSYMIQLGYYGDNNSNIKLNVIDGLTEIKQGPKLLQTPNYITRERFNIFKDNFKNLINIDITEVGNNNNNNFEPKQTTENNIKDNSKYFLDVLIKQINNNNNNILPVVVGHSQYIQHILGLPNKLDNLDAVLIPINKDVPELTFNKESLKFIKLQDILKSKQIDLKNNLNKRKESENVEIITNYNKIIDNFEQKIKCGIKMNNIPKFFNIVKKAVEAEAVEAEAVEAETVEELMTFSGIKITPGFFKSSNIRKFKLIRYKNHYYLQYFNPNNHNTPIGCAFLDNDTTFTFIPDEKNSTKIIVKNLNIKINNSNDNVKKLCPSIIFSENKKNKKYISSYNYIRNHKYRKF